MKKYKENDKIHTIEKKPIPKDLPEIKRDLLSGKHREEAIMSLGKNRGQYFLRLPTRVTKFLQLGDDDTIKIVAEGDDKSVEIRLEIIKGGKHVS